MEKDIAKELEDLKSSINLAHENHKVTQDQVSTCIRNQKNTDTLVARLEFQLREMQDYTRALEDYCISLDTAVRKHHLILSGILEYKNESLAIICYRVLQVCYPAIDISDIDYCYRLGSVSTKGRPVLVKLVRESIRKEILKNRKCLISNAETARVYINEDLPQIVNERRANIKSVHENAVRKGHNSKMLGTKVSVDNITYNFSQLENLPKGLKLSDSKLVAVKGGLAFSSEHSFLSNFYPTNFHINGQHFHSSEQAYQFIRATKLGAPEVADKVMRTKNAKESKKLSYLCTSTTEWDQVKREQMKVIIQEKFFQSDYLQAKLLETGTNTLIEATTDTFWGAGAVLGSKILSTGKWSGINTLGQLLVEIREDVKRTKGWEQGHDTNRDTTQSPSPTPKTDDNEQSQVRQNAMNATTNSQMASRQGISFIPDNFNPNQMTRGKNSRKRGRGRGGRQFNHQSPLYSNAHVQGNHGYPSYSQPQVQMQNQYMHSTAPGVQPTPPDSSSIYPVQSDQLLNPSQSAGMYSNMNSYHLPQPHAQMMGIGNYQSSSIPQSQNQMSIYSQFAPSAPGSYVVNQPSSMGYSNHLNQSQSYASIYPNLPTSDQNMCINSPLPLRPGKPVTTIPNQRIPTSGSHSSHGSQTEVMMRSSSRSSHLLSDDSQSGTSVPTGNDNVFLGPVAEV